MQLLCGEKKIFFYEMARRQAGLLIFYGIDSPLVPAMGKHYTRYF